MVRQRRILPLVAVLSLLAAGCGQLERVSGLSTSAGNPLPATAFALSLAADSIYLVDPATGRLDAVATGLRDPRAGGASWSPRHRSLAFGNAGVVIFDPSTDKTHTLVTGQGTSTPAWNGKGKVIAYGDGIHLWLTNVSSPSPTEVTLPDTLAPSAIAWLGGPEILFAGVALNCANAEGCLATGASDLWTVRPDGTELTEITSTGDASSPKWAPGGKQILYIRDNGKKKFGSQLWMSNPDGTSPHQLTDWKNVVAADWSSDGSQLVALRQPPGTDTLEFWVGASDGTGMTMVGTTVATGTASVDW